MRQMMEYYRIFQYIEFLIEKYLHHVMKKNMYCAILYLQMNQRRGTDNDEI